MLFENLPLYYKKSKVMKNLIESIEAEFNALKQKTNLTENQFFVILADEDINRHEQDVGIIPSPTSDIDSRRGRVMSRLRGTGTVTKTLMKNVALSFINGEIEIVEYPSEYYFAVKFTSKTGIPYNISDIQSIVEEIKPAHLAVKYIFTYKLWQDISETLQNWTMVKTYTWEELLSFETSNFLTIADDNKVYFCPDSSGNGKIIWDGAKAYARRNE